MAPMLSRPRAALRPVAVRKPKGRGHERRDEILAAAATLFMDEGVEEVSTRRIAQAMGISQTTLYVYFPSKNAILDALCDRCFGGLIERFRAELAVTADPVERLRKVMRAYVEFGVEHHDEYRLGFMVKRPHDELGDPRLLFDPATPSESLPIGMQCFRILLACVDALERLGRLRASAQLSSQAIWAAGHGLVTLLITMPEFPWAERDPLIDSSIDIVLGGVLSR